MEISNEEKAKEIARLNGINYKNHSKYEDDMDSTLECYKSAMEAMQWKDEQHEQEKQQWIDKACEFFKKQAGGFWIDHLVYEFKKAMKGE